MANLYTLRKVRFLLFFAIFFTALSQGWSQNVGVNSTGNAPDTSAMLHIDASGKGLLIPRVTQVQRNAISRPATGLLIYQTDNTQGFYYNSGTKSAPVWVSIAAGTTGWLLTGNAGTNPTNDFIGTTDAVDWTIRTNNSERVRVTSGGNVGVGTSTPTSGRLQIADATTTNSFSGLSISQTGAMATVGYGLNVSKTGASVTNVAGQFSASGAISNYAIVVPSTGGSVGIGTSTPAYKLDVATSVASDRGVNISNIATSGTNYGLYASVSGVGPTANIGGYFSASGVSGTGAAPGNNYAIIVPSGGGRVGIGTTSPNMSSLVDLSGQSGLGNSSRGFLMPRITLSDRNAMNPLPEAAQGLMVYQTDGDQGVYFNTSTNTTPSWGYITSGWGVSGNANVTGASNFIGTTVAEDFVIKTNGSDRGRVSSAGRFLWGKTTGSYPIDSRGSISTDTCFRIQGHTAIHMRGNSGGIDPSSVFVGGMTGNPVSPSSMTIPSAENVAVGYYSAYAITTGIRNVMIGRSSGTSLTSGTDNIYIGQNSGQNTTTATNNVGIGTGAGKMQTTTGSSVYIGYAAGSTYNMGTNNVLVGGSAGNGVAAGKKANTVIGANTTGSLSEYNIVIGENAHNSTLQLSAAVTNASPNSSIAIGHGAVLTGSNQMVVGGDDGSDNGYIDESYWGAGVTKLGITSVGFPHAGHRFNATGGYGTNSAGYPLSFAGGKGTGTANGGSLLFYVAKPSAISGTAANSLTEAMRISGSNGYVGIGTTPSAFVHIKPTVANALRIDPFSTSAGNTGQLEFMELAANGSNYVGFKAPDNIASNLTYTLPSADGTNGQVLTTNGSGALSWTTASGGGGGGGTVDSLFTIVPFISSGASSTHATPPAGFTEMRGTIAVPCYRNYINLKNFRLIRLVGVQTVNANSTQRVGIQYSTDNGSTWTFFDGTADALSTCTSGCGGAPLLTIAAAGCPTLLRSAWQALPSPALGDVLIRLVVYGNGTNNISFCQLQAQFR